MDKKTFSRFVNHLEGFTQRIIEHYPNTKDFIEQKTCPPPKQGFEIFVFLYLILDLDFELNATTQLQVNLKVKIFFKKNYFKK